MSPRSREPRYEPSILMRETQSRNWTVPAAMGAAFLSMAGGGAGLYQSGRIAEDVSERITRVEEGQKTMAAQMIEVRNDLREIRNAPRGHTEDEIKRIIRDEVRALVKGDAMR